MMKWNNRFRLLSVIMLIAVHHNVQSSTGQDGRWNNFWSALNSLCIISSCRSSRDAQNESPAVDMLKVVNRKNSGVPVQNDQVTTDQNDQLRTQNFTDKVVAPNCQIPQASYPDKPFNYKNFLDRLREDSVTGCPYESVRDLSVMPGISKPMENGSIVINQTGFKIGVDQQPITSLTIAKNIDHQKK